MNYNSPKTLTKRKPTRIYWVTVTGGGRKVDIDRACRHSTCRSGQFVVTIFRKYFGGREPSFHWHADGFMAEAWDENGNRVTVEQENWWHPFRPGATHMPRPLCPMIVQKQAA